VPRKKLKSSTSSSASQSKSTNDQGAEFGSIRGSRRSQLGGAKDYLMVPEGWTSDRDVPTERVNRYLLDWGTLLAPNHVPMMLQEGVSRYHVQATDQTRDQDWRLAINFLAQCDLLSVAVMLRMQKELQGHPTYAGTCRWSVVCVCAVMCVVWCWMQEDRVWVQGIQSGGHPTYADTCITTGMRWSVVCVRVVMCVVWC
jgi:hypothetical protein